MNKNFTILILILVVIVVVIFLDIPSVKSTINLKKQLNEQKALLEAKNLLLAKIDSLEKTYKDNEESFKNINYILPSDKEIPEIIVQTEALAKESGLLLEDISFIASEGVGKNRAQEIRTGEEATIKVADYNVLTVNLKTTGDYVALNKFLETMEANIRLMDVVSMGIANATGNDINLFNFEIILRTYYQ